MKKFVFIILLFFISLISLGTLDNNCDKDIIDPRGRMTPWEKGAWETGTYRNVFRDAGYKQKDIDAKLAKAYHDIFKGPNRVYF